MAGAAANLFEVRNQICLRNLKDFSFSTRRRLLGSELTGIVVGEKMELSLVVLELEAALVSTGSIVGRRTQLVSKRREGRLRVWLLGSQAPLVKYVPFASSLHEALLLLVLVVGIGIGRRELQCAGKVPRQCGFLHHLRTVLLDSTPF